MQKQIIEHSRTICDLKSLLTKIHQKGAVSVGLEEGARFIDAMSAITDSCKSFGKEDILKLYREFLLILEEVFIINAENFDVSKISSRKLIQRIIGKEESHKFKSVCVIVHIILTACVKISVESVVETLVSRYENHFTSSRQLAEENSLDEMIISENGPALHNPDNLLDRAMNRYWAENSENGKWHFI